MGVPVASLTAASFDQVGRGICGPMCGLTQGPGPGPRTFTSRATHSVSTWTAAVAGIKVSWWWWWLSGARSIAVSSNELVGVFVVLFMALPKARARAWTSTSGATCSASTRVAVRLADWLHVGGIGEGGAGLDCGKVLLEGLVWATEGLWWSMSHPCVSAM